MMRSKLCMHVRNPQVEAKDRKQCWIFVPHALWLCSFPWQKLQLGLPVVWLQTTLGTRFFPRQLCAPGWRDPVRPPQEPERKAAAWTEGKPAELRWEREARWHASEVVYRSAAENFGSGLVSRWRSELRPCAMVAVRCQKGRERNASQRRCMLGRTLMILSLWKLNILEVTKKVKRKKVKV